MMTFHHMKHKSVGSNASPLIQEFRKGSNLHNRWRWRLWNIRNDVPCFPFSQIQWCCLIHLLLNSCHFEDHLAFDQGEVSLARRHHQNLARPFLKIKLELSLGLALASLIEVEDWSSLGRIGGVLVPGTTWCLNKCKPHWKEQKP